MYTIYFIIHLSIVLSIDVVDYMFAYFNGINKQLDNFVKYINTIHFNKNFTMEIE